MRKGHVPSKLEVWTAGELTGKVSELISSLQKIVDQHPNAYIDHDYDTSDCYYEGDIPNSVFTIHSKQPK